MFEWIKYVYKYKMRYCRPRVHVFPSLWLASEEAGGLPEHLEAESL